MIALQSVNFKYFYAYLALNSCFILIFSKINYTSTISLYMLRYSGSHFIQIKIRKPDLRTAISILYHPISITCLSDDSLLETTGVCLL